MGYLWLMGDYLWKEETMVYKNYEEYFYWLGYNEALEDPLMDLKERVDSICPLPLKIAENCREAFIWGVETALETMEVGEENETC